MPVRELESRTVYLPVLGAIVNVSVLSLNSQGGASKFAVRPPVNYYEAQVVTDRSSTGVYASQPLIGETAEQYVAGNRRKFRAEF